MLQAPDFFDRRQILRHFPGVEKRLDEVRLPSESIANLFERNDLLGKWILFLFEHVPFGLWLRVRIVTHNLDQVGVEFFVKRERGACVLLAGLRRVQEVMPETERGPIYILTLKCAVDTLFGCQRSAAQRKSRGTH